MAVDYITAGLAVLVSVVLIYLIRNRRKPPGPFGLPLVGYLPFMTSSPHLKFQELKKKYGPIYSLRLGSRYVVVLNDYQSIKAAFLQDSFIGRPPDNAFEASKETIETGALNGIGWKEQRKFMLYMLRDLGFYRTRMEDFIKEEIHELIQRLTKEMGKPFEISKLLAPSMSNNISSLVFGKRRHFEDPKRLMLDNILREVGRSVGQVAWQAFFPWIKAISKALGLYSDLSKHMEGMRTYVGEEVEEHEESLDPNNIRDFIDGYLLEVEKRKNEPNNSFLKPVLVDMCGALFGGGSETVRVTLDWLLLVAAGIPEVQKKVQAEIDDVIGRERLPSKSDTKNLPYTEAVICELMRWRSIIPINLLRYTIEDTELNSYFIPKDSYVIANLWGVLHEPELWGNDAEEFKPERFLSNDGKEVHKPDYFIPFSIGKRKCPGEPLAQVEVFLYFTSILQKFRVSLPKGATPNFEGKIGLSLQVTPYEICLEFR